MAAVEADRQPSEADQVDFSTSEMRCLEDKIREHDRLTYEIMLRNTGTHRANHVSFGNQLSSDAVKLVSASTKLDFNVDGRILHWSGSMEPGEERRFTVRLITLPGCYKSPCLMVST
jgi:uncharacterized repeat protein (TIGR01451 family)